MEKKDNYHQRGLRRQMITRLREQGIRNEVVLTAMSEIPRHYFLDSAFGNWAYKDQAFPIGHEQTISSPFTVAYQTNLVDPRPKEKILEIGTGSGYQASVLSKLGARVYTVERQEGLYVRTKALFDFLKLRIKTFHRDGMLGLPEYAPFDSILVTAGATRIPEGLKKQLKIGGHLVIPVGDEKSQRMKRITRRAEDAYFEETFESFRFVPFLKGKINL